MGHVGPDEVTGREGTAQRELAGQGGGGNDARETAGVFTGVGGVGAADAEHLEHGGLRLQDGAAAEGAYLEGRHGDGDLKRSVKAEMIKLVFMYTTKK